MDLVGKFLEPRNWAKFQKPTITGTSIWIRVDCNLEDDPAFQRLTLLQQAVLIGIWRLRGRLGKPVCADPVYVGRALCVVPKERHYLSRAISVLILSGFLILLDQQDNLHDTYVTDSTNKTAAPSGAYVPTLTPEDIANGIKIINGKRFNPGVARQIN